MGRFSISFVLALAQGSLSVLENLRGGSGKESLLRCTRTASGLPSVGRGALEHCTGVAGINLSCRMDGMQAPCTSLIVSLAHSLN